MAKIWTNDEIKILIDNYPNNLVKDLLVLLPGRTTDSIIGKAGLMRIRKSDVFHASGRSGRIGPANDIGIDSRFKKKMAGWNKGMKQLDFMSAEMIEKTIGTRFQKGQNPHNTVMIGSERISGDGYIEIKIQHQKTGSKNHKNFVAKHRFIYERERGPIPKGAMVEFVDGDKRNFDISNLELISHRDNLLKNTMMDQSIVKRFFGVKNQKLVDQIIKEIPQIIQLKKITLQLNQTIKKTQK